MNGADWDIIFNEGMLLYIAIFLSLKALALRRRTELGRSLARNNWAMALAYFGSVLALHVPFFATPLWRWSVRAFVVITVTHAVILLMQSYGGWAGVTEELRYMRDEVRDTWRRWGQALWR